MFYIAGANNKEPPLVYVRTTKGKRKNVKSREKIIYNAVTVR